MVNSKKAYIRTIEATIAVIMLFFFLFAISPSRTSSEPNVPENVKLIQEYVINEFQNNDTLRNYVIDNDPSNDQEIDNFIQSVILSSGYPLNYVTKITSPSTEIEIPADIPSKTVYARTIIISSTLNPPQSKSTIITLYIWYD